MYVILDIPLIDIFIKSIATKSVVTLKVWGELKHNQVGHGNTLKAMTVSNLVQRTDYLLVMRDFSKTSKTKITSREDFNVYR